MAGVTKVEWYSSKASFMLSFVMSGAEASGGGGTSVDIENCPINWGLIWLPSGAPSSHKRLGALRDHS